MKIEDKRLVTLSFELHEDGGDKIHESGADDPLVYVHGVGQMLPALELELAGKSAGDEVEVTLGPEMAYGPRNEDFVIEIEKQHFPDTKELEIGTQVMVPSDEGEPITCIVTEFRDEVVVLDANHPLAGLTLKFQMKILDVREATAEDLAAEG